MLGFEEPDSGMDELLAALIYKVGSSDAWRTWRRSSSSWRWRLEATRLRTMRCFLIFLRTTVHYNPSDLSNWLENMLSELSVPVSQPNGFGLLPSQISAHSSSALFCSTDTVATTVPTVTRPSTFPATLAPMISRDYAFRPSTTGCSRVVCGSKMGAVPPGSKKADEPLHLHPLFQGGSGAGAMETVQPSIPSIPSIPP
ncbi:hypothetical protein HPP92_027701 [Vanilla planifolia]|uniref:Transcriptional factor DELLA N-terminal domain-containing protein n=1 Tax=Vanilla planifolia TaxID=51239 RepID=A0A835U781_VANPL|nr:hypothetical protein HPP92_027701 [Vanilla planifolia]